MPVALDLDGVVWRGPEPIAGSPEAVARLKAAGHSVVYVTNNATMTSAEYVEKLAGCGIRAESTEIIHGGHGVAHLVGPGATVLVCAGAGVIDALEEIGADVIAAEDVDGLSPPKVDAVVVGWGPRDSGYRRLTLATRAALDGARLLAPSPDPLYPTVDGVLIGGGALASAVAYAARVEFEAAGKPSQAMIDVVVGRVGSIDLMIGDQLATDGVLAQKMGAPFGLVTSGVAPAHAGATGEVPVAIEGPNLSEVVDRWLSATGS